MIMPGLPGAVTQDYWELYTLNMDILVFTTAKSLAINSFSGWKPG